MHIQDNHNKPAFNLSAAPSSSTPTWGELMLPLMEEMERAISEDPPPPPWGRNCALCLMNCACAKMQDWPRIPLAWEDSTLDGEPRKTECLPYNQSLATFLFDTLLPLSVLSHCRERHIPTFQYFNVSPSCLSFLSFMFLSTMGLKPP